MFGPFFSHFRKTFLPLGHLWLGMYLCLLPSISAQNDSGSLIKVYSAANSDTEIAGWITKQGPDGVLHFGSNMLLSFDGEQWQQTPLNGAQALRGLDFGPDGRLWAGAIGEVGFFTQQATGRWAYHSLTTQLPSGERNLGDVWYAFATESGAVFVTTEKILRWDGDKFQIWSFPGGRRLPSMRSGGVIYVVSARKRPVLENGRDFGILPPRI